MNFLSHSPQLQRILEALGMTIFHSFWQGLLLMVILWALLKWISYEKPQIRFLLSFATLILLLISFVATFYFQWDSLKPLAPLAQQLNTEPIALPLGAGSEVEFTLWDQINGEAYEILFLLSKNAYWMAIFWLAGSFFFSARLGLGLWQVRQLKGHRQAFPEFWQEKVLFLQQQLRIRQNVAYGCSDRLDSPLTLGWLKPIILIPASMLMAMPAQQLESILVHELAHIRRHDYLWNMLQSLSEVVLFYHPAYWYMASVLEQERELACDAITLQVTGKPQVYAQALLQVASLQASLSPVALSVKGRSGFAERIKRIVTPDSRKKSVQPLPFLLSFCLIGFLLFAFTLKSPMEVPVGKATLEQKSDIKEADTVFHVPYLSTYDGYGQVNDMSNLPATGEYLQEEIDYAPSFQEVMAQVPDIVLDTSNLTIGDIYNQYVSLDQSLNTLQKSIYEVKDIFTQKAKINFSAPNVLYLLDGIATDPKKIKRYDVSNIAVYASHMIDGVDTSHYKLVVKAESRKAILSKNSGNSNQTESLSKDKPRVPNYVGYGMRHDRNLSLYHYLVTYSSNPEDFLIGTAGSSEKDINPRVHFKQNTLFLLDGQLVDDPEHILMSEISKFEVYHEPFPASLQGLSNRHYSSVVKILTQVPQSDIQKATIDVSGYVRTRKDGKQLPVPGISVSVLGSSQKAITDKNGRYQLTGVDKADTLLVYTPSSLKQPVQVPVKNREHISIYTHLPSNAVDETKLLDNLNKRRLPENQDKKIDSILFIIDDQIRDDIKSFKELDLLLEKEDNEAFSMSISKGNLVYLDMQEKQYQTVVKISTYKTSKEVKSIVRGKIIDQQTGKPLSGVEVTSLTEESIKTFTDEHGEYELRITEETTYLHHALPGYIPFILPRSAVATFDRPIIMPLKKFDDGKENDFESNLRVFPNPGNDQIKLTFTLREAASVEFEMLDKGGRFLHSFEYHFPSAGKQEITIPTDHFPSDTYLLRTNLNGKYEILRVILK